MLKKRLASLFMSITIAATTMLAAVPTASAYYNPTSFDVELVSAGSTWGNVKKKTVNDANGGTAVLITNSGDSNGYLPFGSGKFAAGTYSFSFDYLLTAKTTVQLNWASWANLDLKDTVPADGTWLHYDSAEYTKDAEFTFALWIVKNSGLVIDNFVLKKDGVVVAQTDYNQVKPSAYDGETGWCYCPDQWWSTQVTPFYGLAGSKYVRVIKHGDGYAAWLRNRGNSDARDWNWGISIPVDQSETYTVSYDYLAGDYYNNAVVADYLTWNEAWKMDTTGAKDGVWHTNTVTGKKSKDSFTMGFKLLGQSSMMIDNVVIKDSKGNIIYENDFDTVVGLSLAHTPLAERWGYTPAYYWDTTQLPLKNWTGSVDRHSVRVIEGKDGGYAMWVKMLKDEPDTYSAVQAKGCPALTEGTYTLSADVKLGGSNDYPTTWLQETKGWTTASVVNKDAAASANKNEWSAATWTVTVDEGGSYVPTFKPNGSCSTMIDNFVVKDSEGNVVWSDDFDDIGALSWVKQEIGDIELDTTVADEVTVKVDAINTTPVAAPITFITCVYGTSGALEEIRSITGATVPSKQTPANLTNKTTVSITDSVEGDSGKTYKAFVWESFGGLKPLTSAESVVIE